jgi:hypothetical protein
MWDGILKVSQPHRPPRPVMGIASTGVIDKPLYLYTQPQQQVKIFPGTMQAAVLDSRFSLLRLFHFIPH